jgi:hypothetical protein
LGAVAGLGLTAPIMLSPIISAATPIPITAIAPMTPVILWRLLHRLHRLSGRLRRRMLPRATTRAHGYGWRWRSVQICN